jgi:hypothetical protein
MPFDESVFEKPLEAQTKKPGKFTSWVSQKWEEIKCGFGCSGCKK